MGQSQVSLVLCYCKRHILTLGLVLLQSTFLEVCVSRYFKYNCLFDLLGKMKFIGKLDKLFYGITVYILKIIFFFNFLFHSYG